VFADVQVALGRARSRLAAFAAQPERHAAHGAKVLLKFKLLELQRVACAALLAWAIATPYFGLVRARWFPALSEEAWFAQLLGDLVRAGAAVRDGDFVVNV